MPIEGRTPKECFDAFRDHLAELLASTVSRRYPLRAVAVEGRGDRRLLGFWQGELVAIPIATRLEPLFFFCSQVLGAVEIERRFRLTTLAYAYRLQLGRGSDSRALIRWEFTPEKGRYPRFHLHADARVEDRALGGPLDLDKVHVATGRVLIEDVIRFLITELGHRPPCGMSKWEGLLGDSERRFYEEFTTPRYHPYA